MTKNQARYQDYPKGVQWCARCSMFRSPDKCTLVAGKINPKGWCKHFSRTKEKVE